MEGAGGSVTDPLVSVIITAYQSARWLPETLGSVMAQTYGRWEVVLVDDGSTDDTVERIAPFRVRLRYVHQPNAGLGPARNAALALAQGDYIALLDADDVWEPEKLAVQVRLAQMHPESGLIACDGVWFDDTTTAPDSHLLASAVVDALARTHDGVHTERTTNAMLDRNPITCPAQTLIPRHVWERVGPFIDGPCQDYDYWLRITRDHAITFHADRLARFRAHSTSMGGPSETRGFVHAPAMLSVWRAHRARCDPADRKRVSVAMRHHVRDISKALVSHGLVHDRRAARGFLHDLARAAPGSPYPRVGLALLRVAPTPSVGRRAQLEREQREPHTDGDEHNPL